jgi:hypothetical protein
VSKPQTRPQRILAKISGDPVALTALILSLFAAGAQAAAWLRGPSVKLIVPDRVALFLDRTPDASATPFVRLAGELSYANVAQAPYGTLVVAERATLWVGSAESPQRWNAFGTIDRSGVKETALSSVQPLPGQSAVTHFTLFTPVPVDCPDGATKCNPISEYLTVSAMAEQLSRANDLHVAFEIELIGGKRLEASCEVPLKNAARQQLTALLEQRAPYFYAMCRPADDVR